MLKHLSVLIFFVLLAASALAQQRSPSDVFVEGHYRNGTWVAPHYRSAPNDTRSDNFSEPGNVNPCTYERSYEPNYSYDPIYAADENVSGTQIMGAVAIGLVLLFLLAGLVIGVQEQKPKRKTVAEIDLNPEFLTIANVFGVLGVELGKPSFLNDPGGFIQITDLENKYNYAQFCSNKYVTNHRASTIKFEIYAEIMTYNNYFGGQPINDSQIDKLETNHWKNSKTMNHYRSFFYIDKKSSDGVARIAMDTILDVFDIPSETPVKLVIHQSDS